MSRSWPPTFSSRNFVVLDPMLVFDAFWVNFCDFSGGSDGKAFAYNEGDRGSIPGSGRSPGEGNGTPLQYSCLENPMDRGAWWATVHGGRKESDTTEQLHFHFHFVYKFHSVSFICMWLSSSPNLICWRNYSFLIVHSWLPCSKSIDHICAGLFLGSLFCSIELYVCFHASTVLFLLLQL